MSEATADARAEEPANRQVCGGETKWLVLILVVAALLRGLVVGSFDRLEPFGDQLAYLEGARELQAGESYTGSRGPAYSAAIALAWFVSGGDGSSLTAPRVLNVLLSLALLVLVWANGRKLFGPRVGLAAAAVLAIHPNYVTFPVYLLSENLYNVTVAGGVLLALHSLGARTACALAAGCVLGLGTLTREMLAWFVPCLAVLLAILDRSEPKRALRGAVALVLGAALVVLPWTARNASVHDRFILVGFGDGIPLFEGNYVAPAYMKKAQGRWKGQPVKQAKWILFHEFKERGAKTKLDRNALYREEAWKAIRERQPTWIFEKLASNGSDLVQPRLQTPVLWGGETSEALSGFLRVGMLGLFLPLHALLFLLVPIGLARWRFSGLALVPLSYVAFSFAAHVVANAGPMRFQMPHEWILILAAASAVLSAVPMKKWVSGGLFVIVVAAHAGATDAWRELGAALFSGDATAHEEWQEEFVPFGEGDEPSGAGQSEKQE